MSRHRSTTLAGVAALFLLTSLFLGLPAIIYQANTSEFSWPFANIVARYGLWAVAVGAALFLPALVLPRWLSNWWAAAVATLAVYVWIHGTFQSHDFGSIDGREWSVDVPSWHVGVEAIVILAGMLGVFWLALRRQKVAIGLMLFLAAGMVWQAAPTLLASRWVDISGNDARMNEVVSFSSKKNALIVLMDTMTADIFEDVVNNSPELKAAFDGFLSFSEAVGVSPTTYLAMPTIHSGRIYQNDQVLGDFFDEAVRDHSVLTRIAEAGYQAVLVNPIRAICPRDVECFDAHEAMGGKAAALQSEVSEILDAVLFRLAPLGLKSLIYNQGQWVVQKWTNDPRFIHFVVEGNSFMEAVAAAISDVSEVPTLKFFHLQATHPPYVYQDNCQFSGRELAVTRENFKLQVKCSLDRFVLLLNALKRQGLYDQTAIMLIADHGNYQIGSARTNIVGTWAKKIASANPTFAIKPIGRHGEFQTVSGEVHISDFGATLCDLIAACEAVTGISAFHAPPEGRTRIFNDYQWKHEYWQAKSLPGLVRREVNGPVAKPESWAKLYKVSIGETVSFNCTGTSYQYTLIGWSGCETWGTWTEGRFASLSALIPEGGRPLSLTFEAQGFVPGNEPLQAKIEINGKSVGKIVFADKYPKLATLDIPEDATLDGKIKIDFQIEGASSPKDAGMSEDSRMLGIGMHWMKIEAQGATVDNN